MEKVLSFIEKKALVSNIMYYCWKYRLNNSTIDPEEIVIMAFEGFMKALSAAEQTIIKQALTSVPKIPIERGTPNGLS